MDEKNIDLLLNDILTSENHNLHYLIDLTIIDFKNLLMHASKKNIKLCYYYDILGCLYDFKINKKSISCFDICNNKIYLKYNSKIIFFSNAIVIDKN